MFAINNTNKDQISVGDNKKEEQNVNNESLVNGNQIIEIRNLIINIGKEKTVLLSTHIMQEVEAMCNRVMIINKGKIVADGKTDELKLAFSPDNIIQVTFTQALSSHQINDLRQIGHGGSIYIPEKSISILQKENKYLVQYKKEAEIIKEEIFKFAVDQKLILTEMKLIESSLEDVFKNVTQ